MSLYRTTMVGLSVLQNVQQAQTNAKLNNLINSQQLQAQIAEQKEEARATMRDDLAAFVDAFATTPREDTAMPFLLLIALLFDQWQKELGVTTRDFDAFQDKDYFRNAQQQAADVKALARQRLSPEDARTVELLAVTTEKLGILEAGDRWQQVLDGMTGGRLIWNGFSGRGLCYAALFPLIAVGGLFGAVLKDKDSGALVFLLLGYGMLIPMALSRRSKAAQLAKLVEPYGGVMGTKATHQQGEAILAQHRKAVAHPWVNLGTGPKAWAAARAALDAKIEQECERLRIPRSVLS